MSELILSSDTINEGRIKINNAYSATTNLWSASTGSFSIIADNSTGNLVESQYSSILGGTNNLISGGTNWSAIAGGFDNEIYDSASEFNCAIIGGTKTFVSNTDRAVALGGGIVGSFSPIELSDTKSNDTAAVYGLKTTKSRVRNLRIHPTITNYNNGLNAIQSEDDIIVTDFNSGLPGLPSDWSFDISNITTSASGRTVELRVKSFSGAGSFRLGFSFFPFGGYKINDEPVNRPLVISASNTLSVVTILYAGQNSAGNIQIYVYGIV